MKIKDLDLKNYRIPLESIHLKINQIYLKAVVFNQQQGLRLFILIPSEESIDFNITENKNELSKILQF